MKYSTRVDCIHLNSEYGARNWVFQFSIKENNTQQSDGYDVLDHIKMVADTVTPRCSYYSTTIHNEEDVCYTVSYTHLLIGLNGFIAINRIMANKELKLCAINAIKAWKNFCKESPDVAIEMTIAATSKWNERAKVRYDALLAENNVRSYFYNIYGVIDSSPLEELNALQLMLSGLPKEQHTLSINGYLQARNSLFKEQNKLIPSDVHANQSWSTLFRCRGYGIRLFSEKFNKKNNITWQGNPYFIDILRYESIYHSFSKGMNFLLFVLDETTDQSQIIPNVGWSSIAIIKREENYFY